MMKAVGNPPKPPAGRVRIDPSSRMPFEPVPVTAEPLSLPTEPHPKSAYVELAVRSNFSFLQAASSPEELAEKAYALGYDAVGFTDRDGLYGIVRAYERCKRMKVRLITGCELTVSETGVDGPYETVRVHVQNATGYQNLCRLLTRSHALHPKGKVRKKATGLPRNLYAGLPWNDLLSHAEGLWIMVDRGLENDRFLGLIKDAFGERASLSVHLHKDGGDRARVRWATGAEERFGIAPVAVGHVLYAERAGKAIYDVLHCIGEGTTLDAAGRKLSANAEARFKSPREMERLFRDFPGWIARTRIIADECTFSLSEIKYNFPFEVDDPSHEKETPDEALRRLTYEGAEKKYRGAIAEDVRAQIEKELALIASEKVAPYFLSVRTVVDMARARDILCQGRGSAANSVVCFCLEITAVDPARSSMLFERFLSAERHEPPDIDVDFEHDRREEVIQAIYKKYGRHRAAMVSEVVCYRGKSALRDVGKVFGLTLEQVERLSSVVTWWDRVSPDIKNRLADAGFDPDDPRMPLLLTVASAIQGYPRHLSVHVGGFVISSEDLASVAPIEPATMKDRTVIPWDKDDIDVLGFFKIDVLGLGILTALRRTFALLGKTKDHNTSLAAIPAEDPVVYAALQRSDTVGVFQIESRAQMAMLPRLKPEKFYDLVVEVAIVRPGPIQGGMIHPYLKRRNGEEKVEPPHPRLAKILDRTLGVPLFQEQVMQIAIKGADYSGGEADQLRRDMASWRKNGNMDYHRQRLAEGFARNGIPSDFAERLYSQIKGFGEYGFPESHAASFAILVYASAWLKVHQPAAFAAAMVNSQPMGFYSASTLLLDAQRHGVEVRPPRIDVSTWDCTLEPAFDPRVHLAKVYKCAKEQRDDWIFVDWRPAVRVGLRQVKGLGEEIGARIDEARKKEPFRSIEDLAHRAALDGRSLEALAEAGALEPLIADRREAMWSVRAPRVVRSMKPEKPGTSGTSGTAAPANAKSKRKKSAASETGSLFDGIEWGGEAPALPPLTRSETLALDYARTGISVGDHPMKLLRQQIDAGILDSRQVLEAPNKSAVRIAGMVICRQRPATASGVVFFTLEDEHGFLNVVLYNHVYERFRHVAVTSSLLIIEGSIEKGDGGVVHVVTKAVFELQTKPSRHNDQPEDVRETPAQALGLGLHAMSRNFH